MKVRQVLALAIAIIIGALASSIGGLWHPYATVKVKNISLKPVNEIEVRFQSTEGKGSLNLYIDQPLKTGEEIKFHFYVESEGAFAIKAMFDDSQTVEGIGGYVELGNTKFIEIHNDEIRLAGSK